MQTPPIIKTSSWFTRLPDNHLAFGISRGTPRGFKAGYRRYPKLFPGPWFNSVSPQDYQRLYHDEVLSKLDPERVVKDLIEFADGQIPTLVCFEAPDRPDWCHRALVSLWLHDTIGLEVYELGHESCGCGISHPMLHAAQLSGAG